MDPFILTAVALSVSSLYNPLKVLVPVPNSDPKKNNRSANELKENVKTQVVRCAELFIMMKY